MKKFINFTYELLDEVNLNILREIGRQIGVKMPAGKKKEVLIEEILAIQKGELEPNPISKKGRNVTIEVDLSKYLVEEPMANRGYVVFEDVEEEKPAEREGVLEILSTGCGFLRIENYENGKKDIYVHPSEVRRYNLRPGDMVKVLSKKTRDGDADGIGKVLSINGLPVEKFEKRVNFDKLTPYYPTERLTLEGKDKDLSLRCIDLFAPIGKGQRALIVAPPKTGKTTLLKKIAKAIEENHPNVKLIVLLIDERPEEVTDIKRSVNAEVVYSTFDKYAEHHAKVAELVLQRAKRLVELGEDVVILMDSITRLTRAYNGIGESSGKVLSGGLDPYAMQMPKVFFGSARNVEEGGSLTVLSTALIETGSKMDDVIYEEFKGTGNMEIHLSRELSEKRVYPAIDLKKSGTRKEELLLTEDELSAVYKMRGILADKKDATETLIEMLKKTATNSELISKLDGWIKIYQK